mmetsp:Transcript_29699/g.79766  ORF Transcript_29699/g.79766 Transcript_29699/m.79766 type:complete len:357 (+) Transcript_29699:160-1230(+)
MFGVVQIALFATVLFSGRCKDPLQSSRPHGLTPVRASSKSGSEPGGGLASNPPSPGAEDGLELPALPRSVVDISRQAAVATLAALDRGHSRTQIHLRSSEEPLAFGLGESAFSPLCEVLNSVAHVLAQREGGPVRLFFGSVPLAAHARTLLNLEPLSGNVHIDVLTVGGLQKRDSACVIVTPENSGAARDSYVVTAVQQLLLQANKRVVVLVNPELGAVASVLRPAGRKVRPMFMADFETAFHFDCSRRNPVRGGRGQAVAVYRAFPHEWEVHCRVEQDTWFTHMLSVSKPPRESQLDSLVEALDESGELPTSGSLAGAGSAARGIKSPSESALGEARRRRRRRELGEDGQGDVVP